MQYKISLRPRAAKSIRRLEREVLRRIDEKILALSSEPRPAGVESLKGAQKGYRLRVGDYRILYAVDDEKQTVVIADIGHRREIYRR